MSEVDAYEYLDSSKSMSDWIKENREKLNRAGWRSPAESSLTAGEQRDIIKADLVGKFQREDWHGVMDCAADLREHDAYQRGLCGVKS